MLKVVEINNLTVQYPDVKALDDVSFIINQGDFHQFYFHQIHFSTPF